MSKLSRKILIPLLLVAFIIPVVTADVIYYYSGTINVNTTSSPITITPGPNGNVQNYITVTTPTGSNPGTNSFTATIYITNSSYAYFYQAVQLTVSSQIYLYITNIQASASYINNMWMIIQSSSGSTVATIQIINGGAAVSSPSTPISLSAGTYYISFLVQPTTPLPQPSTTSIETVTLYLGANVVSSTALPLPPV
ncbi:hypothetical protein GFS03_04690 [Sulfolobus sp. E5-1-F]|uniref:hypothetical protein n=1 Tax=Saccharolobus sp. E5-1-F TaxID=2663019 RepID=UPI001296C982|nr:hypothetical protein [Sulfolobus sp. E5-1-F]QGA53922.1 hypothetical protein GFS03_04690 [Sulfolobus sp. E5-1-F]